MTFEAKGGARGQRQAVNRELRLILLIALPLAGAYLAEFGMFVITKMIVGRLGYVELAAVGLASDLASEGILVLMGILSIVGVLAAEAEGAGDPATTAHRVRQGFHLATLLAIPGTALVWYLDRLLPLLGQEPEVVEMAAPFVKALAPCVLPTLWLTVLRNFLSACERTRPVLLVTLGGVVLNAFLAYGLVIGGFGMPALGVLGAGIALSIVCWVMFGVLALIVLLDRRLAHFKPLAKFRKIDPRACWEIFKLGLPVAILVLLEGGLFSAVGILMGLLGAATLAANQIVLSWASLAFVIALGLAEGTMIRVANARGKGDPAAVRRAGLIGIIISSGIMALLAAIPIIWSQELTDLFLDSHDPAYREISATTATLFVIAALFGVFDGLQAVASRALRGLRDTVAPLWIAAIGYWVVGIGGGVVLAFPLGMAGEGLWWGLAGGLMVTGVALTRRFLRLSS